MNDFKELIGIVASGIEAFGVLIIVAGSSIATVYFGLRIRSTSLEAVYPEYRRVVGRSVILGLEFLIAGDVVQTVVVSQSLQGVAVLALVVVIRAFLSFTLSLEIEGRWPWESGSKTT